MSSSFDFWNRSFRAPLSGDIFQAIMPRFFSPDIKGNPEIEMRVQTDIASFGKQLGKILEAIELLAKKANLQKREEIVELLAIKDKIDDLIDKHDRDLKEEAEDALEKLKKADEKAWKSLLDQSRKDAS